MAKYCEDCGKLIYPKADRCYGCTTNFLRTIADEEERKRILEKNIKPLLTIKYWCVDCGKVITWGATRCLQCAGVARIGNEYTNVKKELPNYCVDCGKEIGQGATRCHKCAGKNPTTIAKVKNTRESNCSDEKQSIRMKTLWREGIYDNRVVVAKSPTRPERAIKKLLNDVGIDYQFNTFKIERFTFDFYLPDFNILIEYDGWLWHKSKRAEENGRGVLDVRKDKLAKAQGYYLLRILGKPNRDLTEQELSFELLKGFKAFRRLIDFKEKLKNWRSILTG